MNVPHGAGKGTHAPYMLWEGGEGSRGTTRLPPAPPLSAQSHTASKLTHGARTHAPSRRTEPEAAHGRGRRAQHAYTHKHTHTFLNLFVVKGNPSPFLWRHSIPTLFQAAGTGLSAAAAVCRYGVSAATAGSAMGATAGYRRAAAFWYSPDAWTAARVAPPVATALP